MRTLHEVTDEMRAVYRQRFRLEEQWRDLDTKYRALYLRERASLEAQIAACTARLDALAAEPVHGGGAGEAAEQGQASLSRPDGDACNRKEVA